MSEEHIPLPEGWLDPQFRGGEGPEFDPVTTAYPVLMPPGSQAVGPGMKPAGVARIVHAGEIAAPIPTPATTPGGFLVAGPGGDSSIYRRPSGSSPEGPVIHAADAWMMTLNTGVGGQGLSAGLEWSPEDEFESSEVEPPGPVIDPLFPEPPVVHQPPDILFPEFPDPFSDYPNTPLGGTGHLSPPRRWPKLPRGSWGEGPRWGGPWWVFPPFGHKSPEVDPPTREKEEVGTGIPPQGVISPEEATIRRQLKLWMEILDVLLPIEDMNREYDRLNDIDRKRIGEIDDKWRERGVPSPSDSDHQEYKLDMEEKARLIESIDRRLTESDRYHDLWMKYLKRTFRLDRRLDKLDPKWRERLPPKYRRGE